MNIQPAWMLNVMISRCFDFQKCFKMIPFVLGGVFVLMVIFGAWVRSVPPKVPTPKIELGQSSILDDPALQQNPEMQEAIKKAQYALKNAKIEVNTGGEATDEAAATEETIEL